MNDPKPLSSAPKAVSYIRFSSKKQASGASLARQLEATRAYCEREGLRLDETVALRDLGVSAWSGANAETGALARFLELVNGGEVQPGTRLIVESIDRISRQAPINAFEIMLGLLRAGIKIVTLMDQQVYDAAALNDGRAHVLLALMQRAHEESQTKSRRIRDALARKKAAIISDRKPATANCPAWLRLSDDQAEYLPVPDKVAVIRRALEMIRDGFGLEMVAKTFNAKKVPPLSRRSRRWHQSYISRLVRNRQLIGEYQPHEGTGKDRRPAGDAILGLYPAVIDKSLFYAAQKAQAKRSTKPGRTGSRVNLFSGLVVDTKGATWVATHKGPRDKHRLVSGAARAGVPGHVYQSIPLDHFEDGLMLMIRQLWERRAAPTPQTDRIDDLLATVADLDAKLGALREKIKSAGVKQVVTLVELVPELERQRSEAATEVERLQAETHTSGSHLPSVIEELEATPEADTAARHAARLKVRQVIREHVEKVVIIQVLKQTAERTIDPKTGQRVRPKGGLWLAVDIVMSSGDRTIVKMFLPSKSGDLLVYPVKASTSPISHELFDRLELIAVHGDDLVLKVNDFD